MFSIGILGFIVWSWLLASLPSDMEIKNNYAISWNSLVLFNTLNGRNFHSYTQSAGNLSLNSFNDIKQSASETTRATSFDFLAFRLYYNTLFNQDSKHLSDNWLSWFIGFVEGDGAIQTYANRSKLRLVITQKESAILYHIHNSLGIGQVKYYPQGKSGNKNGFYRFTVDKLSHILLLAFLFNGNLAITHRINQLSLWITVLNLKFEDKGQRFNSKPVKITLEHAWLSGFTDAEGCFNVSVTFNSRYKLGSVIKMRFLLDQKNNLILEKIKDLFGFGKVTLRSQTEDVYRYTATGFTSMNTIKNYFKLFPLKSKKKSSFDKWTNIHNMVISKVHFTEEGLNEIKILSKQINIQNSQTNKTGSAKP